LKVASLAELERDWSLDDMAEMHEILDMLEHADSEARRRARREAEARTR
jgi:hypothetical protein